MSLTVVLSKLSRHDKNDNRIAGWAGEQFDYMLLQAGLLRKKITVVLPEESLPPTTKVLLLLGPEAHKKYCPDSTTYYEHRGSPFVSTSGHWAISSFEPQEACDRKKVGGDDDSETESDEKSTHGATPRNEWKFWLEADIKKAARILREGCPRQYTQIPYEIQPTLEEATDVLLKTKNQNLFFDIETGPGFYLTCVGFSFGPKVFVVPFYNCHKTLVYEDKVRYFRFLRALAIAFRDNTVVAHNSCFDLFVLANFYGIPLPRHVYDTMLACARLQPELRKSLGHALSLYTDLPYHKNEGVFDTKTPEQDQRLWLYNAKDVAGLVHLHKAIEAEASVVRGAPQSIAQVNSMVYPYLLCSLKGTNFNDTKRTELVEKNVRRLKQYERLLKILLGFELNPRSPKQKQDYLFDKMNYESYKVSEISGKPKADALTLLKLVAKHPENPVLQILLRYASLAKLTSTLGKWQLKGGRMTTMYNLAGTDTFRLSSRKIFKTWGSNFQNWDKSYRDLIVAD